MGFLSNVKIGVRLIGAFILLLLLTGAVGWIGISVASSLNEQADELYNEELMGLSHAKEANLQLLYIGRFAREYFIARDRATMDDMESRIQNSIKNFKTSHDRASDLYDSEEAIEKWSEVDALFQEAEKGITESLRISRLAGDDAEGALDYYNRNVVPNVERIDAILTDLVDRKEKNAEEAAQLTTAEYEDAFILQSSVLGAAIFFGLIVAILLTMSIVRPIRYAVDTMNRVAKGDVSMDIEVKGSDETADLLRSMQDMVEATEEMAKSSDRLASGDLTTWINVRSEQDLLGNALLTLIKQLKDIIQNIVSGANGIANASEEVSATSQNLSQGASEQAASLEETTSSLEEVNSIVGQNADNAKQTESMATQVAKDAREGGKAVNEAVNAMKDIAQKIQQVEDISYQTNILALNAAIEAARAGEHGMGFAVVASEVRKLAERSQNYASRISESAKESVAIVEKAGNQIDKIVPSIVKTSDLIQEIAAASEEQKNGVGQIDTAMKQLDKVTQQSASSSEELSSMAEELSSQAVQLQSLVEYFKLEAGSSNGNRSRSATEAAQTARKSGNGQGNPAPQVKATATATAQEGQEDFEKF